MRLSAGRIRSLATRYALAEAAAFPCLRTEPNTFATNRKPAPRLQARPAALRPPVLKNPNLVAALTAR